MRLWPARCRKCRARKTFKVEPVNKACHCGGLYVVDKHRRLFEHTRAACYCDGYPWSMTNGPHRKGSPKCRYAPGCPGPQIEPAELEPDWANNYPF